MPVTIVVPLQGPLAQHRATLESVREHVDLVHHRVSLVNDAGPDTEAIEQFALALFEREPNVTYFRSERALGFAGSCEHAITGDGSGSEAILIVGAAVLTVGVVEELMGVMELYEKNGLVFPRAPSASIASIPLRPVGSSRGTAAAAELHQRLSPHLPRYAVTPFAVGPCLLVRRQLIDDYGLGPAFTLDGGQVEFSLRVNRYGHSAIMANHAFVDQGAESPRAAEREIDAGTLERSPFAADALSHYLRYLVDPIDWFAERLFEDNLPKVLIDLRQLDPVYNGSSRYALSFLSTLAARRGEIDADITLASSPAATAAFDLHSYGFRVVTEQADSDTYDLGFALSPITDQMQILTLNRSCVRWVVSCLDVISLRVVELLEVNYTRRQVILDGLRYADRVITISESTLDDVVALFGNELDDFRERSRAVLLGLPEASLGELSGDQSLPDDAETVVANGGYVLLVGNDYPHKRLVEAARVLEDFGTSVIVFGPHHTTGFAGPYRFVIPGGRISDGTLDRLYRNAACVVYPSSYEGFGLPIVESTSRGVPVVLHDSPVSREVVEALHLEPLAHFFGALHDLPGVVEAAIAGERPGAPAQVRTLVDYNEDVIGQIAIELGRSIDLAGLRQRVRHFQGADAYSDSSERALRATLGSRSVRIVRTLLGVLAPLRRGAGRRPG